MKFKKLLSTMLALVCFISTAGVGFVGKVEAYNGKRLIYDVTLVGSPNPLGAVWEPNLAGTTGTTGLQTLAVNSTNLTSAEKIRYRSFAAGQWQPWVQDAHNTGVAGAAMTALEFELVNMPDWVLLCRARISGVWTDWVGNGSRVGSIFGQPITAVQIYLRKKVDVLRIMRLYHDATAENANPNIDILYNIHYLNAFESISNEFSVFIAPGARSERRSELNGGQQPVGTCPRPNDNFGCSFTACGQQPTQSCIQIHHRNTVKLWNNLNTISLPVQVYRMGLVGHMLCGFETNFGATSHSDTRGGIGDNKTSIATARVSGATLELIIQHEITHSFNILTHCGGSDPCVMKANTSDATINKWCDNHKTQIENRRNAGLI